MQIPRLLEIDDPAERYRSFYRRLVSRQAQCQVSPGRVSYRQNAAFVQAVFLGKLSQKAISVHDVTKRAGPPTPIVADSPVFQIPCRQTLGCERSTQVTCVREIVLITPESAVNIEYDRMGSSAMGES